MKDDFFISYDGEMLPKERESLYGWIGEIKPKMILEVGTGSGASTYYMNESLKSFGIDSIIHTCDPSSLRISKYILNEETIKYHNTTSDKLIRELDISNLDFIFFDGPEDEDVAINDLEYIEPKLKKGCYFSMHDWEFTKRLYDNGVSIKSNKIRPYMENSDKWELIEYLEGVNSNESVGLCLYKFNG